jgi:hypothetical protein
MPTKSRERKSSDGNPEARLSYTARDSSSADKELFRFRLEFRDHKPQQQIVEFELSAEHAMVLMTGLQDLQRRYKIRKRSAHPTLRAAIAG